MSNIRNYGAMGDGETDDTAAIQAAASALLAGETLCIPATLGGAYYRITAPIQLPSVNGIVLAGEGLRASQVRQVTPGADLLIGPASAANGWTLRDLWLEGNNQARYGFDAGSAHRLTLERVRVAGCALPGGAGLHLRGAVISHLRSCEIDACWDGVQSDAAPTAISAEGCHVENCLGVGWRQRHAFGLSLTGTTFESCQRGGVAIELAGLGVSLQGCYFEENRANLIQASVPILASSVTTPIVLTVPSHPYVTGDRLTVAGHVQAAANGTWLVVVLDATHLALTGSSGVTAGAAGGSVGLSTFDLSLGEESYCCGVSVAGNYFNGRPAGSSEDYYPVRVRYLDGAVFSGNGVNTGNRWLNFEQAMPGVGGDSVVTDVQLGPNGFRVGGVFDNSDMTTVYGHWPSTFTAYRNRFYDQA